MEGVSRATKPADPSVSERRGSWREAGETTHGSGEEAPRILVVQNHPTGTPGRLGEALEAAGARLQVVTPVEGDPLPGAPGDLDGLIVLGGPQDAKDDAGHPYLPALLDLICAFHAEERPILGLCLGGQLLARAFGAEVTLGGPLEIGFVPITATAAAAGDPLLHDLGDDKPIFAWHRDCFEIPDGAVQLATGRDYPAQAFRMGRSSYGVQFHFEVTREVIETWVEGCPWLVEQEPEFLARLPQDLERHLEPALGFCERIAGRWFALTEASALARRAG